MRLLLVHNDYGRYSGEEAVIDRMSNNFTDLGVSVSQFRTTSKGFRDSFYGQIKGFFAGIYSIDGIRSMTKAIEGFRPDVVNVHNLYPFISPAALRACKKSGVPIVMTVHNYRLVCPTGLFMRDGHTCEDCLLSANEWGCVKHNCERSWPRSIGYALRSAVARWRRDYIDCVDRFVCVSEFQKSKLVTAGFDEEKISVIPNVVYCREDVRAEYGGYVAYCGRISYEKGVDLLIEAARMLPHIRFRLAGTWRDGKCLGSLPDNVEYCGFIDGNALEEFYKNSMMVVIPSRCYEGLSLVALEGASHGKPLICPRHGAFPEFVGVGDNASGLLFNPGVAADLALMIRSLYDDPNNAVKMGRRGLDKIKNDYSVERVMASWIDLLQSMCLNNI